MKMRIHLWMLSCITVIRVNIFYVCASGFSDRRATVTGCAFDKVFRVFRTWATLGVCEIPIVVPQSSFRML